MLPIIFILCVLTLIRLPTARGVPVACQHPCPSCADVIGCAQTTKDRCQCCDVCVQSTPDDCGPRRGACLSASRCRRLDTGVFACVPINDKRETNLDASEKNSTKHKKNRVKTSRTEDKGKNKGKITDGRGPKRKVNKISKKQATKALNANTLQMRLSGRYG